MERPTIGHTAEAESLAAAANRAGHEFASQRLKREGATIAAMIHSYCRDSHGTAAGLCAECQGLLEYAELRLRRCRFGTEKPTCVKCPVHCYTPGRREQIRAVMRYAGPRMLWQHPVLALRHWLDGLATRRKKSS